MATERKREQVALLEDRLRRAQVTIGLDYRGLTVGQMQALRRRVRGESAETELRVVKNTLLKRAAEAAEEPEAGGLAREATALLFGFGDLTEAPRALRGYLREANLELPIHGVYVEGALEPPERLDDLADVPPRPELMAKLAGGLNSPVTGVAGVLNTMLGDLARVMAARADQMNEGQQDGGAEAESAPAAEAGGGDAAGSDAADGAEAESADEAAAESAGAGEGGDESGADGDDAG